MISEQQLKSAKDRIAEQISTQCRYGKQTTSLPETVAACGQFFNDKNREQRGIHGTASALRVIAENNNPETIDLIPRLVTYIKCRREIEAGNHSEAVGKLAFDSDENNVIKLSEVLYSLTFVKPAQYDQATSVAKTLADRLMDGFIQNKGWPHFLGTAAEVDPLPTAFAILALCRNGYENKIGGAIQYISNLVCNPTELSNSFSETSVQIYCLYALINRKSNIEQNEREQLQQALKRQWKAHEALMRQDIEQNIEYWRDSSNCYVRIPWQLYLISSAAVIKPILLYRTAAQSLIRRALDEVNSNGFRYPYSGSNVSTRTNAILYGMLTVVMQHRMHLVIGAIILWLDKLRSFCSKRSVRILTFLFAFGSVLFLVLKWYQKDSGTAVSALGPNLAAAAIGWILSYLVEGFKK